MTVLGIKPSEAALQQVMSGSSSYTTGIRMAVVALFLVCLLSDWARILETWR